MQPDPDLNAILRMPGALDSASDAADGELEASVMAKVGEALDRLNQMREEEGRGIERELRERMAHLSEAAKSVQQYRRAVLKTYVERLQSRIQELLGAGSINTVYTWDARCRKQLLESMGGSWESRS